MSLTIESALLDGVPWQPWRWGAVGPVAGDADIPHNGPEDLSLWIVQGASFGTTAVTTTGAWITLETYPEGEPEEGRFWAGLSYSGGTSRSETKTGLQILVEPGEVLRANGYGAWSDADIWVACWGIVIPVFPYPNAG